MITPVRRNHSEERAAALAALEPVAQAASEASPEELETLIDAAIAAQPGPVWLAWNIVARALVRARRAALGLPLCSTSGCPGAARPTVVGLATVSVCLDCEVTWRQKIKHINPSVEE